MKHIVFNLLRFLWILLLFVLPTLLVVKFICFLSIDSVGAIISFIGIVICLYLLFMLEGLQVAGIQVKDHNEEAIDEFLRRHRYHSEAIKWMHSEFATRFDAFITGRQVFVIITVVSLSLLINSIEITDEKIGVIRGYLQVNPHTHPHIDQVVSWLFAFLESPLFSFSSATLFPAWISQLLPQFAADNRAISFMNLPFAGLVTRLAMLLDWLQIGRPSKLLLSIFHAVNWFKFKESIPLGSEKYYEALLDFYGWAINSYKISFNLGKMTTVQESVQYIFSRGKTQDFNYRLILSQPVEGDFQVEMAGPEGIDVSISEVLLEEKNNFYEYTIKILLSEPLPREHADEEMVELHISYPTKAYHNRVEAQQMTEYTPRLPTRFAHIIINGDHHLLCGPEVGAIQENSGSAQTLPVDDTVKTWSCTTPTRSRNQVVVKLDFPTIATVYQIQFGVMETPVKMDGNENRKKIIESI